MVFKLNGVTRLVILIGNYAIKIPNFTKEHRHFLYGCYANYSERNYCKVFKPINEEMSKFYNLVAPSYFCSWFGLIQIQGRCKPINRHLTKKEINFFKDVHGGDYKKENFGYYNDKLVCLDYA